MPKPQRPKKGDCKAALGIANFRWMSFTSPSKLQFLVANATGTGARSRKTARHRSSREMQEHADTSRVGRSEEDDHRRVMEFWSTKKLTDNFLPVSHNV